MELTTEQIYALLCLAAFELIAAATIYWVAHSKGYRSGHRNGYRIGIEQTKEQLQDEVDELADRCSSAERLLNAVNADLRTIKDLNARALQDAREAYEAQAIQLADAKMLNDTHARLLRQSAGKLGHLAEKMQLINLTDEARQSTTLAGQLRDLAAWLNPKTQPQHMERAA